LGFRLWVIVRVRAVRVRVAGLRIGGWAWA